MTITYCCVPGQPSQNLSIRRALHPAAYVRRLNSLSIHDRADQLILTKAVHDKSG